MYNKALLYLAAPYSHPNLRIREQRYGDMLNIMAHLLDRDLYIISPLMLNVPVTDMMKYKGTDWKDWKEYDLFLLSKCDELWIATLDGWRESKGVRAEVKYALDHSIPITLINRDSLTGHFTYDKEILQLLGVKDTDGL